MSAHDPDARMTMESVYSEMTDFVTGLLREIDPDLTRLRAKRRAALIVSMVEGSGLFVGHGRRPSRDLVALQVEVKNTVREIAGCCESKSVRSTSRRKVAK
jgi:hypothetical protein